VMRLLRLSPFYGAFMLRGVADTTTEPLEMLGSMLQIWHFDAT
jgi:hypothetical protein